MAVDFGRITQQPRRIGSIILPMVNVRDDKVLVVASAAIFDAQGRLLLARRNSPGDRGGRIHHKWELPGGKADEKRDKDTKELLWREPSHLAAVREAYEELGVRLALIRQLGIWPLGAPASVAHDPNWSARTGRDPLLQDVWAGRIACGEPQPKKGIHDRLCWVESEADLQALDLCPEQEVSIRAALAYGAELRREQALRNVASLRRDPLVVADVPALDRPSTSIAPVPPFSTPLDSRFTPDRNASGGAQASLPPGLGGLLPPQGRSATSTANPATMRRFAS